jgi:hypothetical protein
MTPNGCSNDPIIVENGAKKKERSEIPAMKEIAPRGRRI